MITTRHGFANQFYSFRLLIYTYEEWKGSLFGYYYKFKKLMLTNIAVMINVSMKDCFDPLRMALPCFYYSFYCLNVLMCLLWFLFSGKTNSSTTAHQKSVSKIRPTHCI